MIIRTANGSRVQAYCIAEAARLAAFLSRHGTHPVPVDYTLRKYKEGPQGPPGLHIFEREKTLMVEPTQRRRLILMGCAPSGVRRLAPLTASRVHFRVSEGRLHVSRDLGRRRGPQPGRR